MRNNVDFLVGAKDQVVQNEGSLWYAFSGRVRGGFGVWGREKWLDKVWILWLRRTVREHFATQVSRRGDWKIADDLSLALIILFNSMNL